MQPPSFNRIEQQMNNIDQQRHRQQVGCWQYCIVCRVLLGIKWVVLVPRALVPSTEPHSAMSRTLSSSIALAKDKMPNWICLKLLAPTTATPVPKGAAIPPYVAAASTATTSDDEYVVHFVMVTNRLAKSAKLMHNSFVSVQCCTMLSNSNSNNITISQWNSNRIRCSAAVATGHCHQPAINWPVGSHPSSWPRHRPVNSPNYQAYRLKTTSTTKWMVGHFLIGCYFRATANTHTHAHNEAPSLTANVLSFFWPRLAII